METIEDPQELCRLFFDGRRAWVCEQLVQACRENPARGAAVVALTVADVASLDPFAAMDLADMLRAGCAT